LLVGSTGINDAASDMRLNLQSLTGSLVARAPDAKQLSQLRSFGSNPGDLKAWFYLPKDLPQPCSLVVVLHGCTQMAQGFNSGSGWSELADRYGFAVLFPEQQRSNNANLCFNWFEPADTRRGSGEALSIAQMVDEMMKRHDVDPHKVFITGLSAGGAMTSVMLAAYPEKFAGGAILAGLPHGAAASMQGALQQMRAHSPSGQTTGSALRAASGHKGRWPVISVWHGTADTVVDKSNAGAIVRQWREVLKLSSSPTNSRLISGHYYRSWHDDTGKLLLEEYTVRGMGHGLPLDTMGDCACGAAGAFMLEAGISSTVLSAKTWGLLEGEPREHPKALKSAAAPLPGFPSPVQSRTKDVIEQALRAAGLMK
jgi:poly(hydroxyalkanoate) depolymerase family esterase